ncbi:hypothetical protein [Klebsiella aerogenes]|uniref:hypothetical protein n=1 Tax=Klebsiella aerogenes TaxID=548 RepID=UPI001CC46AA6|nr:hypothetical protein [Klebsiella aerogenes]UNX69476.1 hypothetical protein MQE04_06350 [Klebsiella aerogenes]
MAINSYVRVYNGNPDESYDVGPFGYGGNESAFHTPSAMNWIYKQIGIIKTKHPDSPLIKHRWSYIQDDFLGPKIDIKVEIHNIIFETFNLVSPEIHNVIDEQTTYEYPDWVKNEHSHTDENN